MLLHAQSGFRGKVIDLDTGQPVHKVIWFDTDRQEIEAYQLNQDGSIVKDVNGDYTTYRAKGRFKFIPEQVNGAKPLALGAPKCTRCGSKLTLLGSDLCAFCNAIDKNVKGFRVKPLRTPLLDQPCQQPGCGRLAEYQVSDEVEVSPEIKAGTHPNGQTGKVLYERGAMVGRRYWCSFHFQPPRLLDAKGEVMEVFEKAGGVRPE